MSWVEKNRKTNNRGDDYSGLESTSVFTYYNALAILILIIY